MVQGPDSGIIEKPAMFELDLLEDFTITSHTTAPLLEGPVCKFTIQGPHSGILEKTSNAWTRTLGRFYCNLTHHHWMDQFANSLYKVLIQVSLKNKQCLD